MSAVLDFRRRYKRGHVICFELSGIIEDDSGQ